MNEKENREFNTQDVRSLLRGELNQKVSQNLHHLEGLEQRVVNQIEGKEEGKSPVYKFFGLLEPLTNRRIALGLTGLLLILAGIFIGMFIGGGFGTTGFTANHGPGVWFVVAYPEATRVAVAGDFTNWDLLPLSERGEGIWAIKLDLSPGRYEYNFVVNDSRWILDPRADEYAKSFGEYNSVVYVEEESA